MREENKEPTFGDIIIKAIKEPKYWDKMESVIDDRAKKVYDIDNTSMYDTKPIMMNLDAHTILGKINIPEIKDSKLLDEADHSIIDSSYRLWCRSDEGPNRDMNKEILKRMTEKPFIVSTK